MTARQQWTLVLGVVALLGLGLWVATRVLADELFPVTIGSEAPPFRAVTTDGAVADERTLEDYGGRVVLLNIWATWCGPCREEMPSIQALHDEFADDGLAVVAVSVDDPGMEAAIRDFARSYGLSFEILHDATGEIRRVYQTTGVPETFLIGRDGRILRKQIGATDWNSAGNRALVAQLLGVADPAHTPTPGVGGDTTRALPVPTTP
jgi:cytochrome c biogenesis protein CcmG/thiol:disulfide interchange protein DsbE